MATYTPPRAQKQPTHYGELLRDIATCKERCIVVICNEQNRFFDQASSYMRGSTRPSSTFLDGPAMLESRQTKPAPFRLALENFLTAEESSVVFCPSIPVFRAWLGTVHASSAGSEVDRIVIVDMLAQHNGSTEFTVQGISRTLASIASMQGHMGAKIDLVECSDYHDPQSPHHGVRLWSEEVPLLSASIKIGSAGQGWAGRRCEIKEFARRWVSFE